MADVIVRVVYDGTVYDLDIDSNIPLRIDISAVENQDIGTPFGVGSQQFDLPGTKSNNRFFKHGYNVGANAVPGFYNSIPGYIIFNGETVLDGQFQLLEIVTDDQGFVTYKCRITDQVVTFYDALGSKLIKNGNWSYLDHALTYANITSSWAGDLLNDSVYYPFAFYGFDDPEQIQLPWPAFLPSGSSAGNYLDNSLTPIQAQQLVPAVKVKDTLDVIFEQVGFNYTGSFVSGSEFEQLYILPKAQESLGIVGEPGQVATCNIGMTTNQTVTAPAVGNTNIDLIELDQELSDPTNAFNATDHYYQLNGLGSYTFTSQIYFFNPTAFTGGEVEVTLTVYQGTRTGGVISGTVRASQTVTLRSTDGFNTFGLSAGASFSTSTLNEVFLGVSYKVVSGSPSNLTLLGYGTNFQCTDAPQAVIGANVNMGLQFGNNAKSIDILNGLIQQFNLVLSPIKGNEKTISIDSFDTWIRNGRIKDWTDKYNTATRIGINHTVDEQPKELILSGEEDVDRFSKLAKENDPFRQYGSLRLIADNNVSLGSKKIGSYFAPVIPGGPIKSNSTGTGTPTGDGTLQIDTATNFAFPHLYKLENSQVKSYSFKPRIGYKVTSPLPVTPSGNVGIWIGPSGGGADLYTGSYATIANVSEFPATSTSKNLYFNSTYTPFTNTNNLNGGVNAYDDYWATYIESLYWEDSVKVTMDLEFNQNEYYNINLNDRVFIKDTFYRINKINGFNLSQDDIATVELIKLYPAYFEGLDFTGCTFEVSASNNVGNCAGVTPTPTPTPTLTPPGFTWTPTPTPTATPTATPTSTPTPTATPPGFTWTPTPTPTATPLFPTPTPTPATVYELSASLGSTSQFLCTAELVQSAYTTTPISSWPSATLYTDSGLTTAFAGGNNFFRFESGSDNVVWSVNNFGTISVEGQNCSGSLYSFYGTSQTNLNEDPCSKPLTQTYYTLDFNDVNQLQAGDRIYVNASLTGELADNHLYAFSNTSASNAYETTGSECRYFLIGGASSVGTCIPATPTPTPTILPNLTSASIDAGSTIGGEGCFNDPTGSVYLSGCLEDLLVSGGFAYEDMYGQTPFDGTDKKFMMHQSASSACSESRALVTISSTGYVSQFATCGTTVTAFSASYELNTSQQADVCSNPQTLMVYSDTRTSAAQIQSGDKLYLDAALSGELLDGYLYAVADVSGSDGYDAGAYKFQYSVLFGAGAVTQCIPATPTPTPTIPPTMTSASIDAGSTIGGEGCFNDPTGSVYLRDSLADILVSGGNAYTDEQTQIPFSGGTKKYMIHQSASVDYSGTPFSESRAIVTITDAGAISLVNTCSLQVYQFYGTSQVNLNDDPCLDPYTRFVYTDAFSDVADMQNGDRIYSDGTLAAELNDNHLYSISNVSASSGRDTLQSRGFKYTLLGGVSQIVSCQPTSSLYYGTTPTTSNPCGTTTPNAYYLTSSVAINEIVPGTRLYSDAGATTEITANDQWIGLGYNVSPATGEIRVYYRTGAGGGIISVQDCGDPFVTPVPTVTPTPTPTATPTATPTPTPTLGPQSSWRGTTPTSGDPCLNTTPLTYYTTGSIRIDQWSLGMRLYSDAGTTTEITADEQYIGITDLTNNSSPKIKVYYTQASGITNIDDPCSPTPTPTGTPTPTPTPTGTPTATPTATPTPTPTAPGFEQQISNARTSSTGGCGWTFTGTKYTPVAFADLTINTVVYDDANLTTVFNGNNRWYRFGQSTASGQSYLVYINTNGQLQQIFFC